MNPLAEQVFIGEIVQQTKIANRAAEHLKAATDPFDALEVWCSIQSILVAAGIVSRSLWPSKKFSSRGVRLRTLLGVDEGNLLSKRKFRDHFEHYDERIEVWFEKNRSAVYTDSSIDPFDSIWGPNPVNRHRAYNPETQVLTFRGESLDLAALLNVLEEIQQKCRPLALV